MNRQILCIIGIVCCWAIGGLAFAQQDDRAAAERLFQQQQYAKALPIFLKIQEMGTDPVLDYHVGVCYLKADNYRTLALQPLFRANQARLSGNTSVPLDVTIYLAQVLHLTGNFLDCVDMLAEFIQNNDTLQPLIKSRMGSIRQLLTYGTVGPDVINMRKMKMLSVEYPPFAVNSQFNEWPGAVSTDGQQLFLTSDRPLEMDEFKVPDQTPTFIFDQPAARTTRVFQSFRRAPEPNENKPRWEFPVELPIKLRFAEVVGSFDQGKGLLILGGNQPGVKVLYQMTMKSNEEWGSLERFPSPINISSSSIDGACLLDNGTRLIFSSNRTGGFGGYDLYQSILQANGKWSEPFNLGGTVNTVGDEINPFVPTDKEALYFSSNGPKSMGYFDIFRAKRGENIEWEQAENMGLPINSVFNDDHFTLSADRKHVYIATDRENLAYGGYDLLSFPIKFQDVQVTKVTLNLGLTDKGKYVSKHIVVKDQGTGQVRTLVFKPDSTLDQYEMYLPPNGNYVVEVYGNNALVTKLRLDLPENTLQSQVSLNMELNDLVIGKQLIAREVQLLSSEFAHTPIDSVSILPTDTDRRFDPLVKITENLILQGKNANLAVIEEVSRTIVDPFQYEPPGTSTDPDPYWNPLFLGMDEAVAQADPWLFWDLGRVVSGKDTAFVRVVNESAGPLSELVCPLNYRGELEVVAGSELAKDLETMSYLLKKNNPFYIKMSYQGNSDYRDSALRAVQGYFLERGVFLEKIAQEPGVSAGNGQNAVTLRMYQQMR